MNAEKYWEIIEESRTNGQSEVEQVAWIVKRLQLATDQELEDFVAVTESLLHEAYKFRLAFAFGYVSYGGDCGEDDFEYYRAWLILQGRDAFYRVLKDPDSLAEFDNVRLVNEFLDVAVQEYNRRHGEDTFPYSESDLPVMSDEPQTDDEFEKFNESAERMYPKLAKKYDSSDQGENRRGCS